MSVKRTANETQRTGVPVDSSLTKISVIVVLLQAASTSWRITHSEEQLTI
jgi:hypothetical protein